jgi:hypothetical protein
MGILDQLRERPSGVRRLYFGGIGRVETLLGGDAAAAIPLWGAAATGEGA